jgi:hypothetical protein
MNPLLVLVAMNVLVAQPTTTPGPAPIFSVVQATTPEKGHAVLIRRTIVIEQVPVREKFKVDGRFEERVVYQSHPRSVEYSVVYDIGTSRVITPDGKQLPIEEVWKRMKPNTVVAISGDFNTPAPTYLRALHPQVLVIIPAELKKSAPMPQ